MTINAVRKIISLTGPNCSFANINACRVDVVGGGGASLLYFADFESGSVPSGWSTTTANSATLAVSSDTAANYGGSAGSIKGNNPAVDDVSLVLGRDLSALNLSELYIQFKAKMPSADKRGLKFCKIFGQNSSGYANCTFNLHYPNGEMRNVIFGDGSGTSNDAGCRIGFDNDNVLGRNSASGISVPQMENWSATNWGTSWHDFKFHVKFNSGTTALNEVADGEFHVWIDEVQYLAAAGLFNRHHSNLPIERIEFYGYSTATAAFELWYDNIRISTGGFA